MKPFLLPVRFVSERDKDVGGIAILCGLLSRRRPNFRAQELPRSASGPVLGRLMSPLAMAPAVPTDPAEFERSLAVLLELKGTHDGWTASLPEQGIKERSCRRPFPSGPNGRAIRVSKEDVKPIRTIVSEAHGR